MERTFTTAFFRKCGAIGGSSKSVNKRRHAKINGLLGGRPKKCPLCGKPARQLIVAGLGYDVIHDATRCHISKALAATKWKHLRKPKRK